MRLKISIENLILSYRNPTPERLFDSWHPYDSNTKYVKILGTKIDNLLHNRILKDSSFEQNHEKIDDLLASETEERIQVVSSSNPAINQPLNPYHLSNVNYGAEDENNRISRNFNVSMNVTKNTDYYFYLKRIYAFWYEYLPSLYKNYQDRTGRASLEHDKYLENCKEERKVSQYSLIEVFFFLILAPKYKHAFFSMLTLVCLLLAILGVCVYILRKNNNTVASASSIL